MSRRILPALFGATLIAAGLVVLAPQVAHAATTSYPLDCNDPPSYGTQTFYVSPGDTVTFDTVGFDIAYDWMSPTPTFIDPAGATVVLGAGDKFDFFESTNTCTTFFTATVEEAGAETVPPGTLLFTQDITLAETSPEITVAENDGGSGEHLLDGVSTCGLSTDVHGRHVYATLDITVLTGGTYTFRGMASDPAGYYVGLNPYDPMGDPFLAVYSTFDPTNPDADLVGCNDDLNDVGASNDAEYLADGTIIEGHQPFFSAAFTPGQYTLVLMTWEDMSTSDFATGFSQWEDDSFAIGDKTDTFQLWGPVGGLALGHVTPAGPALAATGSAVDPIALVGGGIAVLGGLAILIAAGRRRRSL